MAKKKFSYKVPSIVALTLAGTALATHHQAEASEVTQDDNKNVLDDEQTLKHAGEIKDEVSQPTANISGTQVYKDPSMIHNDDSDDESLQYDAALDELDASTEDDADASNEDPETDQAINQQDEELQSTEETEEDTEQDVETSEKENEETELEDATLEELDSSDETELEQQTENDDNTTDEQQVSDDETTFETSTHNQEDADEAQAANLNTYQKDETSTEEKQDSTVQDDEVHSFENNTLDTDEADSEALDASQQDNESTEADHETSNDTDDAPDEVSQATKQEEADVTKASSSQAETEAKAEDDEESSEQYETDVEEQKDGQSSESADNQKENTKRNQVESEETTVKDEIENDEADKETAEQASTAKSERQEDDQTEATQPSDNEDKDETQNDTQDQQQESENDEADQSSEAINDSDKNETTDDTDNSAENDEAETSDESDENESSEVNSEQNDQDDTNSHNNQLTKDDEEQATDEEAKSEDQEDASSLETDDAQSDNDIVESDENDETETSAVTTYRLDDEPNTNEVRLHSLTSNQPTTPLGASSQQGNTEENVPVTLNRSASPRVATTRQAQVQGSSREANERATSSLPKYEPQVESPINDYIRQQNFPVPEYENSIADFLPKNSYRYGHPEGIVMHDTANDNSTIDSEINYMKNNYNAAFVHAFVDGDHIIETANTDYGAWGAGPYANDRFIHVELVHTHDFESFARSINNYADYAATNLQYYGLEPDSAEYDGQGTVWTHNAVSNHLGGTDHTDPIGYLEANNYSYDELYDLINEKYLIKEGKVAPWGTEPHSSTTPKPADKPSKPFNTTDNQSSGLTVTPLADAIGTVAKDNHGLYSTVYDEVGTQNNTIGGNTYKLSKKATLNDDVFYLINDAGNDLGWVQDEDILDKKYNTSQTHKDAEEETKSNAPAKAAEEETKSSSSDKKESAKKDNSSSKKDSSSDKKESSSKKDSNKKDSSSDKKESSSKKDSAKKDSSSSKKESSSKKDSTKKDSSSSKKESSSKKDSNKKDNSSDKKESSSKKDSNKKDSSSDKKESSSKKDSNKKDSSSDKKESSSKKDSNKKDSSSDKKESSSKKDSNKKDSSSDKKESSSKKDSNKKDSSSSKKESSSKKDSAKKDSSSDKKESSSKKDSAKKDNSSSKKDTNKQSTVKTTSVNQLGQVKSNNNGIYATIYDEESKTADNIANKTYKVTKKAEYNNESFVLLQNVNQPTPIGWVKAEDVKARPLGKTKTKNGEYKVKRKNNGLYSVPMGTKDQLLDPLDGDKNYKFKASKAVKVGDDEYVYGSVNNKTGWIAGDDLKQNKSSNNQTNTPKAEPSRHKTLVINNKDGEYYTSPNASSGKSLADYYNSAFSIIGKAKVEGETWYYGTLSNGKKVWIKSDDLAKSVINYLKTGMTLDEAVSLQFEMGANPQIQHNAGTWDDASYAEVKQAMDTDGLAHDATQKYQFLRLDKPQNIAVNDLNKLLDGKGILAGQGEAFSEAANTYGLNEVYLISHALLETGNGTSTLATGGNTDGSNKKYYNMYGIGAYDHDAITTGFNYAKSQSWDTVKKAIVGGAQFIAGSFIQDGQNTLYKMRWNPDNPGTHQYATDVNWARQNASIMKQMYDAMDEAGKFFDVDTYKK